jgi:hypothetical protein
VPRLECLETARFDNSEQDVVSKGRELDFHPRTILRAALAKTTHTVREPSPWGPALTRVILVLAASTFKMLTLTVSVDEHLSLRVYREDDNDGYHA